MVGVGGITRQISRHQRYLHSTSCFSLRPQFVRNNCGLLQSIILSQPSLSAQSQHYLLQLSLNNIPAGRGLLKLLSAKNIKSGDGSGQCSVFSLQRCGDSQTELLFLLELFLLTAATQLYTIIKCFYSIKRKSIEVT